MNQKRYPQMSKDTKWIIKIIVGAAVLFGLLIFIEWLTAPALGQPITKTIDWRLERGTGRIFAWSDQAGILVIGGWSEQLLETQRLNGGRVRVLQVVGEGGEHFLVGFFQGPPSRGGEWQRVAIWTFWDSVWQDVSGEGELVELGDGGYRLVVRLALAGTGEKISNVNIKHRAHFEAFIKASSGNGRRKAYEAR